MIDVDIAAPPQAARPPTPVYQQKSGLWDTTMIVGIVCVLGSLLLLLWFVVTNHTLTKDVAAASNTSQALDAQIAAANKTANGNVEQKSLELVSTVAKFQKLVDGRKIWSKLLPILSANTLQGVSLTGISVDDKLVFKVDGITHQTTIGSDTFTPYGLVARQVVAYRDASDATLTNSDPTKTANVFSNVTLTAISQSLTKDTKGSDVLTGRFSVTFSMNPALLALPAKAAAGAVK